MNRFSWLLGIPLHLMVVKHRKMMQPSRTIGNVNSPPRNIEEVLVSSPIIERMTQVMGNWERLIEHQTQVIEVQSQVVEAQAQATKIQSHGQSFISSGSIFQQFKKLGHPFFKGESNPIVLESWILNLEKYFDVMGHFQQKKKYYYYFLSVLNFQVILVIKLFYSKQF